MCHRLLLNTENMASAGLGVLLWVLGSIPNGSSPTRRPPLSFELHVAQCYVFVSISVGLSERSSGGHTASILRTSRLLAEACKSTLNYANCSFFESRFSILHCLIAQCLAVWRQLQCGKSICCLFT